MIYSIKLGFYPEKNALRALDKIEYPRNFTRFDHTYGK